MKQVPKDVAGIATITESTSDVAGVENKQSRMYTRIDLGGMGEKMRVAYCTGFWCTNIGNGFFSMGVEYALKKILGEKNVTVVSDLQTYTTSYGKRLYVDRNQLEYISSLDVDYVVLAGPVLSRYFLELWEKILLRLKKRGVGYIILSAGTMKLNEEDCNAIKNFFKECQPYALSTRDQSTYDAFSSFARHSYNGICFSFFTPDCYSPAGLTRLSPYVVYNFDKIMEPKIVECENEEKSFLHQFEYEGVSYCVSYAKWLTSISAKTDRFTDALIYVASILPAKRRNEKMGRYRIIRTDHRFHPHFRRKIYQQANSFVADLPYGYLNLYANADLTLSDRVHACAVTLAFGHSAMLFAKTNRCGLLERIGAEEICEHPVKLDLAYLESEKVKQLCWLDHIFA